MEEQGELDMKTISKHVTWDEKTIAEHDKERGTRMIINEPKTPFNKLGIPEDPNEEEKDTRVELLQKLNEIHDKQVLTKRHVGFEMNESDDNDSKPDSEAHEEFVKKRRMHYNEYQEVLRRRRESSGDEENA